MLPVRQRPKAVRRAGRQGTGGPAPDGEYAYAVHEPATPQADIIQEAARLTAAAQRRKTILNLTGGLGVYFHSPSTRRGPLRREYRDLDFVSLSAQRAAVQRLLEDLGYAPDIPFNTLQGQRRLRFWDPGHRREVDVFLDQVRMCHRIDLRHRLRLGEVCLAPADLLLTKMQVVEINEKDLLDIVALLADHPTGDGDAETINRAYIAGLAARDWGLYRTLQLSTTRVLEALPRLALPAEPIRGRLAELWQAIEMQPKPVAWRLRARIGDRLRWYEIPEEGGPA